ncbi:alpha/beta hydrolase [Solihabitans fulvus]|uniref:Alpha/beta hydrolase n=1 Tax=Solihabitans fulvus TaxID=1892852 RepID=A0A5B2XDH3_9PSEU|nr:alpha/beta hydrolase [Solihabitans fulvus]
MGLVTACSAGASNRPVIAFSGTGQGYGSPTTSTGPLPLPPLETPQGGKMSWSNCADATRARLGDLAPPASVKLECARMSVALDAPNMPGRGHARISVLKVGSGPTPLVVVNDAGGEPGSTYAARLAAKLPPEVLNTFSLIGIDRRGTGGSDAVQCVPGRSRTAIIGFDPAQANTDGIQSAAGEASRECVLDLDIRLGALDTWRASSDLEDLRTGLGASRINAIGRGDGAKVLTTYASRFPGQVGRMVLDGAPDPTLDTSGRAEARAVGAEAAFQAFATDCAARGCPLGADPKQKLLALLDQLRGAPLRTSDGTQLTAGTALNAVLVGLGDRASWPALGDAIAKAATGDGTGLATLVQPLFGDGDQNPPRLDADLVTGCNDDATRITPQQVAALAQDWRNRHPLFGGLFAQRLLLCGPWSVPNPPQVPSGVNTPPMLVVSTAGDPVTPQSGTERAAQQLSAGVLVGWQGGGHGALGQSSCATAAAQHFLIDGKSPTNGTVCPP